MTVRERRLEDVGEESRMTPQNEHSGQYSQRRVKLRPLGRNHNQRESKSPYVRMIFKDSKKMRKKQQMVDDVREQLSSTRKYQKKIGSKEWALLTQ